MQQLLRIENAGSFVSSPVRGAERVHVRNFGDRHLPPLIGEVAFSQKMTEGFYPPKEVNRRGK